MENLVTSQRVAEYLGVSPLTVDKLVKTHNLPCSRIGTLKRYDMDLVKQWAREQVNAPAPAPRRRKEKTEEAQEASGAPVQTVTDLEEDVTRFV